MEVFPDRGGNVSYRTLLAALQLEIVQTSASSLPWGDCRHTTSLPVASPSPFMNRKQMVKYLD